MALPTSTGLSLFVASRSLPGAMGIAASDELQYLRQQPEEFLHESELLYYSGLSFDRRRDSYLLGRVAAKRAVQACGAFPEKNAIEVSSGIFGQPVILSPLAPPLELSISHSGAFAVAVACAAGHPLAVDLERYDRLLSASVRGQMTQGDVQIARLVSDRESEMVGLLWTAKEALSKVLKCGLTIHLPMLELSAATHVDGAVRSCFRHFPQYQALTWFMPHFAISLVAPRQTKIGLDSRFLRNWLGLRELP